MGKDTEDEKSEGVDENGSKIANYHEYNFPLRSEDKVMAYCGERFYLRTCKGYWLLFSFPHPLFWCNLVVHQWEKLF